MNRYRSGRLSTVVPTFITVQLDRDSDVPLYQQVEMQIRAAIHGGRLRPGARVPGIRTLAEDLGVARVTVAVAYEQLAAEGYLDARVGSGTRVATELPGRAPVLVLPTPMRDRPRIARLDLRSGAVPAEGVIAGFPMAAWESRLRAARRDGAGAHAAGPAGAVELRVALSAHLDAGRGTRTDPRQIVVGHGPRVLLAALIAALDAEGGPSRIPVLGLLEPVDPALRTLARRNGATTLDVPIDRAAVHAAAGVVLVEDDRAAMLRLAGWLPPSLQGSLAIGRIVLIGGLGRLVVPGSSLGWIVLPGALADAVADAVVDLDGSPSTVDQRAIAGWIADGGLDRRVRRLRHLLRSRRAVLEGALGDMLGPIVDVEPAGPDPVLTVRLALEPGARARLAPAARAVGLLIDPPGPDGRLDLGYAALDEDGPIKAAWRLSQAVDAVDPQARHPVLVAPSTTAQPSLRTVGSRVGSDRSGFRSSPSVALPGPGRLDALGRALAGRRGPVAEP
jgi:GntR family transcriptional regulator / MocR family aminotransferase